MPSIDRKYANVDFEAVAREINDVVIVVGGSTQGHDQPLSEMTCKGRIEAPSGPDPMRTESEKFSGPISDSIPWDHGVFID
jgi:hypothetical protein